MLGSCVPAASATPVPLIIRSATLFGNPSCTSVGFPSSAASESTTAGSSSISTSIASTASRAW